MLRELWRSAQRLLLVREDRRAFGHDRGVDHRGRRRARSSSGRAQVAKDGTSGNKDGEALSQRHLRSRCTGPELAAPRTAATSPLKASGSPGSGAGPGPREGAQGSEARNRSPTGDGMRSSNCVPYLVVPRVPCGVTSSLHSWSMNKVCRCQYTPVKFAPVHCCPLRWPPTSASPGATAGIVPGESATHRSRNAWFLARQRNPTQSPPSATTASARPRSGSEKVEGPARGDMPRLYEIVFESSISSPRRSVNRKL